MPYTLLYIYYYTDQLSIWLSVDPLADKYPHLSPYAYCSDNPIMRIDPDGMADDWVESKDGKIYWDDNATSQETTKNGEKYLEKNVLVATHNRGEQLNEPINSAKFELYLEGNKDGVSSVIYGNTVPADVNEYGTLAEGLYFAEFGRRAKYVKRGDYDPGLLINKGKAVPTALGSPKSTITEIFFHKGNNNRESLSDNRENPYSAGCQTGGNYKGSHKAYYQFAKNLVGFKGSYYLRGQSQQKQSQNSVILKIDIIPLPNDNTRIVHSIK